MNATKLSLKGKGLDTIPSYVFKMPNLVELKLDDNSFTTLPDTIGNLKNLTHLHLSDNYLTSLPESIENLKKLKVLTLDSNRFSRLPESITKLKNLEFLDISDMSVTNLPENFGNLARLKVVYLIYNKLTRLPETIGNLKNLKAMDLTGNPIKSLPKSFRKLPETATITFRYNDYTPAVIANAFQTERNTPVRINNSTNFFNRDIMNARLGNIPTNRRAFINTKANVKNNGTLRRVYNIEGLMKSLGSGRLHGGTFTRKNITLLKNVPHTVNKRAYLRNIKNRLANTSPKNLNTTVIKIKNALPSNVSRNDVNQIVRNILKS